MAHGTFLAVNLVTPRGVIAHTESDSLQAPGDLGEFELLPGHVPMLTALKAGVLTIGTKTRAKYAVSTGYLRIDPQGAVEILVERAKPASEIDAGAAQSELKAAEADLAKWGDKPHDGEYDVLKQRADWAQAQVSALAHN
ncbi:MAG: ATP synthase F1 subunit epsilon [Kofleriaceae bacterium]